MPDPSLHIKHDRSLEKMSDDSLVVQAKEDHEVFAILYKRYVQRVYRYLYTRVKDPEDAEDLTSQVFIEAFKGLPRYRHKENFIGWLFKIAQRRAIDHSRRVRQKISLDEYEDKFIQENEPLNQSISSESLEDLRALIQALSPQQQEMLRLRFAAGLTYSEMAVVLNKTEAAIKMALHRLYRQLENAWENEDD
jgi:RNA polymerase sigma-70 factor (ECF subfamily)